MKLSKLFKPSGCFIIIMAYVFYEVITFVFKCKQGALYPAFSQFSTFVFFKFLDMMHFLEICSEPANHNICSW